MYAIVLCKKKITSIFTNSYPPKAYTQFRGKKIKKDEKQRREREERTQVLNSERKKH